MIGNGARKVQLISILAIAAGSNALAYGMAHSVTALIRG